MSNAPVLPLWIMLLSAPATAITLPEPAPWRLVTTATLHVGVRPAGYFAARELSAGATVQVTIDWPRL